MPIDYYALKKELAQLKHSQEYNHNTDYRNNLEAVRLIQIAEEALEAYFSKGREPKAEEAPAPKEPEKPKKPAKATRRKLK